MSNILLILFPSQLFENEYIKKILYYTEDNVKIIIYLFVGTSIFFYKIPIS